MCSKQHSGEEQEHDQRMVSRVQWHIREGAQGRYRKAQGRPCGSSQETQEPENEPTRAVARGARVAVGRLELLSPNQRRQAAPYHLLLTRVPFVLRNSGPPAAHRLTLYLVASSALPADV